MEKNECMEEAPAWSGRLPDPQGSVFSPVTDWHQQHSNVNEDPALTRELLLLLLLSRFSRVRLCATPQMAAHQAPPSLGFSRQEHWSGLPFPSPVHKSEK